MNKKQGEESQHDRLYLRLKILFAGYKPSNQQYESTIDYFIDHILFKAYNFVIELRQLLNDYQKIKQSQTTTKKLEKLLNKIYDEYQVNKHGVKMSIVQINALLDQIKVISPYRSRINQAQHGVFNNLQYFMDIANGIRKIHLKKANQLLPQVFNNLINRSSIKELLQQDLQETKSNFQQIEQQVNKKINAVQRMQKFYTNFFESLEQQLQAL